MLQQNNIYIHIGLTCFSNLFIGHFHFGQFLPLLTGGVDLFNAAIIRFILWMKNNCPSI